MNTLALDKVYAELGARAKDPASDLSRLANFLGADFQQTARRAQSIISRSEAELFGNSMPRFAMRVYLTIGGFVNCRRLQTFIDSVQFDGAKEWGKRYDDTEIGKRLRHPDLEEAELPPILIRDVIGTQSHVADSVLPPPCRLNGYEFIRLDGIALHKAYGEFEIFAADVAFTPYVKCINLGGGLCAQSVCFAATTALQQYASCICGLAEITAYAHNDRYAELTLSGLTPEHMERYFARVNLSMSWQRVTPRVTFQLNEAHQRDLGMALRAYLGSNMPVIFPTDAHKLATEPDSSRSVYGKNGWLVSRSSLGPRGSGAHTIMLVGYSRPKNRFVFHDPGAFPYMVADLAELASLGSYRDGSTLLSENGVFFPVVPGTVKMPLFWMRRSPITGSADMVCGITEISRAFHVWTNHNYPVVACLTPDRFDLRSAFQLAGDLDQLSMPEPSSCAPICRWAQNLAIEHRFTLVKVFPDLLSQLLGSRWKESKRWFWLETHLNCILLWDAEKESMEYIPSSAATTLKYLRGMVYLDRGMPRIEIIPHD